MKQAKPLEHCPACKCSVLLTLPATKTKPAGQYCPCCLWDTRQKSDRTKEIWTLAERLLTAAAIAFIVAAIGIHNMPPL